MSGRSEGRKRRREPRLGARAADGEDEQRALAVRGGRRAETPAGVVAERAEKAPARIEATEAPREVALRDDELRAAEQLVGQREARHQDALGRHAVSGEAPHGALGRREVANAAPARIARDPGAREIRVGHEAVDLGAALEIGRERRREERREQRRLLALERREHAAADAALDEPLDEARRERRRARDRVPGAAAGCA